MNASEARTYCLSHQQEESCASPLGLICPDCFQRLGRRGFPRPARSYWESQPRAWSLDRRPCFCYVLKFNDLEIRSLHPAEHVQPDADLEHWADLSLSTDARQDPGRGHR